MIELLPRWDLGCQSSSAGLRVRYPGATVSEVGEERATENHPMLCRATLQSSASRLQLHLFLLVPKSLYMKAKRLHPHFTEVAHFFFT